MFSILVLAGSSVIPMPLVAVCFLGAFGAGAMVTWAVSLLRLRQFRKLLAASTVGAVLFAAMPDIISNICSYWFFLDCWL